MPKRLRPALRARISTAKRGAMAAWAVSGTALIAIMIAVAGGGATYAALEPAPVSAPAPPPPGSDGTQENVRVALDAANNSRVMFGLLSNAVKSSTDGLDAAVSAVPQIFDSVDQALAGTEQINQGLSTASQSSSALGEAAQSAQALTPTLDRLQDFANLSTAMRASGLRLRTEIAEAQIPESGQIVARLDQILAAPDSLVPPDSVSGLRNSLQSLTAVAQNTRGGIESARGAASQLHEGLSTISAARPRAEAAVANLRTGVTQLTIVLDSLDQQLALIQTKLNDEQRGGTAPVAAATPPAADQSTRLGWALAAAGLTGAIAYIVAMTMSRRMTRSVAIAPAAPLADLARALGDVPTPAHGFARPIACNTDPWLPVHFTQQR